MSIFEDLMHSLRVVARLEEEVPLFSLNRPKYDGAPKYNGALSQEVGN